MANPNGTPRNLKRGNNAGNKGGTGRPPSALRALCREGFEQGITAAIRIVNSNQIPGNPDPEYGDVLRAFDLLGKYGGVDKSGLNDEVLKAIAPVLSEYVPADLLPQCVSKMIEAIREVL